MRRAALIVAVLALSTACGSFPTLNNEADTATNLYESRNYDEQRACEVPNAKPRAFKPGAPGWCAPCADALNVLLDAKGLANDATKRAGRAPEQRARVKAASDLVKARCVGPVLSMETAVLTGGPSK